MNAVKRAIRFAFSKGLTVARVWAGKRDARRHGTPRRILIVDGAHVGDLVIATGLLPVLKAAFPGVEIGFVVGSWSSSVLKGHPDVAHVHLLDHWRPNRSKASRWAIWMRHMKTQYQCLKELRAVKYDWAICLHPYYPDLIPLAWWAGIPVRIAFSDAVFAPLATHIAPYAGLDRTITQGQCFAELLQAAGIEKRYTEMRKGDLPPDTTAALSELHTLLEHCIDKPLPRFVIVHMGAGSQAREWPTEFWREVVEPLTMHAEVLLTGVSERERANAEAVGAGLSRCRNACGRLTWQGMVTAVRHAEEIFTVDTSISHVAAAVETPCQVVATGISFIARWRPDEKVALVWSNPVPCSPCYRANGCKTMECKKGVRPSDLLGNSLVMLGAGGQGGDAIDQHG